ncbi:MAG: alpha/beta fold hydrolase [Acidobacteriia bacterium]|nr:alpha/beta fold hydrolase [Terriglobia bacterium]
MITGKPVVALVFLVSLAAFADPRPYNPDRGPLRVLTIDELVLHDSARDKDLRLKIYYPEGPGPFPVVIFSHGAFASREAYSALGQYWASYGYVSIHPSHADSRQDSGYRGTLRQVLLDSRLWRSRPKDISFVIDSLAQIERLAPTLKGKLDRARIGVGGHSYGAYTAVAIGGATVLMPGAKAPQSFADKRVRAIVALSPQGEGEMGLTSRSWEHIRVPMLAMYGSRDFGTQRRTPTWRSQPFNGAPEGDKYDVELQGATHFTFVGPFRRRAIETNLFKCAKLETIAFWDTYLKDDEAAREYLAYEGLKTFCGADARLDRK